MNHLARYNLIDESWIPVRFLDGRSAHVGLAAVFREAHAIRDLDEPNPANRIALYRVLLAILHRALGARFKSWGLQERRRWRREGLPSDAVLDYLEHWRERFWLVHPEHPFMQVAVIKGIPAVEKNRKSPFYLTMAGNDGFLFEHRLMHEGHWPGVLRDMLGLFCFVPGKKVRVLKESEKAGPLANSAAFMALGANLGETLLLNLGSGTSGSDDLPAWEKPPPSIQDLVAPATLAAGPNDRYTRQSRGVLLDVDDAGMVREIRFSAGIALLEDPHAPDPMVAQSVGKSKDGEKIVRTRFNGGRALWRDLPSITADAKKTAPAVLRHAAEITDDSEVLHVLAAGLASDQGKLERVRMELLRLPHALLAIEGVAAAFRKDVTHAEALYDKLHALAARVVALTQPDPNHEQTRKKARERVAQSPLADVYFTRLEQRLPELMAKYASIKDYSADDWEAAHRFWQNAMTEAAHAFWRELGILLSDTPRAWRAMAQKETEFNIILSDRKENRDAA
ncbi:type I-E CRISPR-associated protein Cse1/CasA [Tepidiphilus baoligensis]|uniref:Type I-E CRISPR-associated protein Cse1/CasA n=1 Tax=Tepidiphilus baoligensis TaxID=2698687 RepID=A0ABX1QKK4_9PROT|nr:type I-E CRISPR-associated protein Cse1/CasA [Tepidiphilus baoligensis]NMH16461.1 type I-E CRISPR-associated protein Cse1/CasA [Tepidiphilus baoligensis]